MAKAKRQRARKEHPAELALIDVAQACVGCSDDLLVELHDRWRLFVRRPDGMYEVTVHAVEIGAPTGPG